MNGGHCFGMAHTSQRFFEGVGKKPSDFQAGAENAYDLYLSNARRNIAYYFVEQLALPAITYIINQRFHSTPVNTLADLQSGLANSANSGILVLYGTTGGHAITPYTIKDQGSGLFWVMVYDNNWPNDANRHLVINTTQNTWSYDLGGETWNGDANTHSLFLVPSSLLNGAQTCPMCWLGGNQAEGTSSIAGGSSSEVWLQGGGHLLISDAFGRRIGFVSGTFVNEIPGAYQSEIIGGLGIPLEPIYTLPLTETYTILLEGQTLTQSTTASLAQFATGYAVAVDDITLAPGEQDQLTIANDGSQVTYQSSVAKQTTLTLALDGTIESYQFQTVGTDIGAGQVVTLSVDISNGKLVFDNRLTSGGSYDLLIARVSNLGRYDFVHHTILIAATDTQYINFSSWDGNGQITLEIDHNSDGTIDETIALDNQLIRLFLPLLMK